MYILVYIKKFVYETKSKRDKHNFKYFKGGAIWILATGAILYRYASVSVPICNDGEGFPNASLMNYNVHKIVCKKPEVRFHWNSESVDQHMWSSVANDGQFTQ
jgi:hypothetical protein